MRKKKESVGGKKKEMDRILVFNLNIQEKWDSRIKYRQFKTSQSPMGWMAGGKFSFLLLSSLFLCTIRR